MDGKNPEEDTFERSQNDEDPSRMEPKSATLRYRAFLSSTISNTFYVLRVPSSETKFKFKSRVKTDKYNKIGKSNRRELRRDIFRLSPLHVDEVRGKRSCVRG